jgi:hypothetical protein
MLAEPQITADKSAQLNLLLSQYLRSNRIKPHPISCPPWRNLGRQPVEQDRISLSNTYGTRRSSRESPVPAFGIRHFD